MAVLHRQAKGVPPHAVYAAAVFGLYLQPHYKLPDLTAARLGTLPSSATAANQRGGSASSASGTRILHLWVGGQFAFCHRQQPPSAEATGAQQRAPAGKPRCVIPSLSLGIPTSAFGSILGRDGVRIKAVEAKSGARVLLVNRCGMRSKFGATHWAISANEPRFILLACKLLVELPRGSTQARDAANEFLQPADWQEYWVADPKGLCCMG